ncbi:MAG: putative Mg2+ transporter-C (MgtC) family protein [Parcubacteria group bacterium Gr01-1014_44]|nr:MAG: putative Mg2+ transporter-C (MgtC) family protein [Parcubacteria group bacterium Gr01-1014_44]
MDIYLELFGRILLAAVLGAAIGFERERSQKAAGLRTNALVAMGAALLTIISLSFGGPGADPSRIISNIIVGIGFIGGGAILREGQRITGITTAATLWVVAAIGIAVGMGFYREALFSVAVVYFILTILWLIERKVGRTMVYPSLREKKTAEDEHGEL